MPIGHITGYDLTLDGRLGLNLFRDGRTPALVGGRFGPQQAVRQAGGAEYPVTFDRLDGGMGVVERSIPNTFALGIDACTRFGRVWTPGGEITRLSGLPNGSSGRPPGEIRALVPDPLTGTLLVAAGGVLLRIDPVAATVEVEWEVAANEEIEQVLLYEDVLLVGTFDPTTLDPGFLYVKPPSGAWAVGTAHRQHLIATYFQIENAQSGWRLIANDTPYSFKFFFDPDPTTLVSSLIDDTAWISDGGQGWPVADRSARITDLVGAPLIMFFLKEDGVYHVQPDGRAARIVDWRGSLHPDNGKHSLFAYGSIFASHHAQGLVQVDVANLQVQWQTQACAPGWGTGHVTPIHGDTGALGMDGEWLVDVVYNGRDSFVCYGRPAKLAEAQGLVQVSAPQPLVWHGSEATFWGARATAVAQAALGTGHRPLLWVAVMEGTTPVLSHVSLPDAATPLEDWLSGGPHRFAAESWLYLPREDLGGLDKGWAARKKIWTTLGLTADYLVPYQTWLDVFMTTAPGHSMYWDRALDIDETIWRQLGRLDEASLGLVRPLSDIISGVRAAIMFRGHATATQPFAFYAATLAGIPVVEQSPRLHLRCTVGRSRKANQALEIGSRDFLQSELFNLQWSDPVSLVGRDGLRLIGNVEEGVSWQEVVDPQTKQLVSAVTFDFKVLARPFIWGGGSRWGTSITWN